MREPCANNTRTFERAGSAVIGAPRLFANKSALTSGFRKSEFWCKGVRFVCTNVVRSNLTPLHQGPDF